jgi:dihydrodipicolinate synthase/N-acetylneuraminate lyase
MKTNLTIASMTARRQPGRRVQGIAAALLPFQSDGRIAVDAFQRLLVATHRVGMMNAVNMDTGYINYLSESEKKDVLRWTREALGNDVRSWRAPTSRDSGETVALYRQQLDAIASIGGTPILFQTARLKGKPGTELAAAYQAVCRGYESVMAFELGSMFASNEEIF